MTRIEINKYRLQIDDFKFKCSIGKNGLSKNKQEGDFKTPKGSFKLKNLYYRADREKKPKTNLKCEKIRHNTICCNDEKYPEFYNKILKNKKKIRHEKLYRKDYKYNFVLTLDHNNKRVPGKGSCVFIHLTKNYKSTAGCVALKRKDFLILIRLVKKKTKILIK